VTLWPRFIRRRWEAREWEAAQAEHRLLEAKAQHAHVGRLTAERDRIRRVNGFTEAIRTAIGVTDGSLQDPRHG
jgi:hypothetical protein